MREALYAALRLRLGEDLVRHWPNALAEQSPYPRAVPYDSTRRKRVRPSLICVLECMVTNTETPRRCTQEDCAMAVMAPRVVSGT